MFIAIPDELIGHMESNKLLLLSKLYSFHRMNLTIYASNDWLAEYMGVSKRYITKLLAELEKDDLIERHGKLGGGRKITITTKTAELYDDMNIAQKADAKKKYQKGRLPDDIKVDWWKDYQKKLELED